MDEWVRSVDNRISLYKLEVFCRVVDLRGVRLAAEDLFVSQPVVSAHLHSLEERFGAKLFQKKGRGIELTESGRAVYLWATGVLKGRAELDQSLRDLGRGEAGRAAVGCSMSVGNYVLPPVLVEFRRAHPAARVSLHPLPVEAALDGALAGRFDFCVLATDAVLDSNAFDAELIARPPFALVASARDDVSPVRAGVTDLQQMRFICPPSGMAIRRSQDAALAALGVTDRRVEMELGSAESMKSAVAAGLGVALLWRVSVQRELMSGELREISLPDPTLRDKLYLVRRQGHELTPLQLRLTGEIRRHARAVFDGPDR